MDFKNRNQTKLLASQSLLLRKALQTLEVINHLTVITALQEDKGRVILRVCGSLKALRGLSCAFKEHPLVWKPGSYSLPAPRHPISVQLTWCHLFHTHTHPVNSRCLTEWIWISAYCYLDVHFLLFTPRRSALKNTPTQTHYLRAQGSQGD